MANTRGWGFDGAETRVVNCEECGKKIKKDQEAFLIGNPLKPAKTFLVHADGCAPDPGENEQLTDFR